MVTGFAEHTLFVVSKFVPVGQMFEQGQQEAGHMKSGNAKHQNGQLTSPEVPGLVLFAQLFAAGPSDDVPWGV